MGTTKQQHHRHHSNEYKDRDLMDTYIPPYSILHRVAPPPTTALSLQQRLEAPQHQQRQSNRCTDHSPSHPHSPTSLAERLDLPPSSTIAKFESPSPSSTPNHANYNINASTPTRNNFRSFKREGPYTRQSTTAPSNTERYERSPDNTDTVQTIARKVKKGNYERPSSFVSSRTSSIEPSRRSSTSLSASSSISSPSSSRNSNLIRNTPTLDRTYFRDDHASSRPYSFVSSANSIPVSHHRLENRRSRSNASTGDDGSVKMESIDPDDSGYGDSLVERISPPSDMTDFHLLAATGKEGRPESSDTEVNETPTASSEPTSAEEIPSYTSRSGYVYEPSTSTSSSSLGRSGIEDDTIEEGELVEEDDQDLNSGVTKVLVSNLEPGTTAEDVAAVFHNFGEIRGIETSPVDFSGDLDEVENILIAFTTEEGAKLAISKMNGVLADGRRLSVFG